MTSMKFRGARAILAGGVLAMAAMSLPAQATSGEPAPVQESTSVAGGWSRLNRLISASYDRPLDPEFSNVAVIDKTGLNVGGFHALASTDPKLEDARILTFTPWAVLTDAKSPYTVTFTAHGVDQDTTLPDTVDTTTFSVDTKAPRQPTLDAFPAAVAGGITPLAPGEALAIAGAASDIGISGVASFELHFFNPVESAQHDTINTLVGKRFDEVTLYRRTVNVCSTACPAEGSYAVADANAGLPAGYWTLRVVAIDVAGNRSAESSAVSFIATGA